MRRFVFPREVLLVEVERRCGELLCGARIRLSLTKEDAHAYTGFECERCGRWYADALTERDVPEWWEELNVASLRGLKPAREVERKRAGAARELPPVPKEDLKSVEGLRSKSVDELSRAAEDEEDEAEVVSRMSREWRRLGRERETAPEDAEVKRGDSF